MSEALTTIPTIPQETRDRLMLAIALPSEETKGLAEIAQELEVTPGELVQLLNEPEFLKGVKAISMARANIDFHSEIGILGQIARTGENRDRLTAIRTLAQITGNFKQTHQVDVRVSFEDWMKEKSDDPLARLFDIKPQVIEGEIEEVEGDEYGTAL
jgi:hypothetical protein